MTTWSSASRCTEAARWTPTFQGRHEPLHPLLQDQRSHGGSRVVVSGARQATHREVLKRACRLGAGRRRADDPPVNARASGRVRERGRGRQHVAPTSRADLRSSSGLGRVWRNEHQDGHGDSDHHDDGDGRRRAARDRLLRHRRWRLACAGINGRTDRLQRIRTRRPSRPPLKPLSRRRRAASSVSPLQARRCPHHRRQGVGCAITCGSGSGCGSW